MNKGNDMKCASCGANITDKKADFCGVCGSQLSGQETKKELGSVDRYFMMNRNKCEACDRGGRPLRHAKFMKNMGLLVARREGSIEGNLCKQCINKYFISYTLTDLFLGWWGFVSFLVTPFFILNNIWYFLASLGMKKELDIET